MNMENDKKTKLKEFWLKYESKIILISGFFLVAGLSFEAGVMKSAETSPKPVIIEKSAVAECQNTAGNAQEASSLPQESQNSVDGADKSSQNCAFVGSKNSNKYHLPTCRWAKNIKPENQTCFSSADEAKSKGYLPDKTCIK